MSVFSQLSVVLGYFLDGHAWPGPLHGEQTTLGSMALGPMGFLSMLQTWLGLPGEAFPGGQRIAQCLRAARSCCRAEHTPFYAPSLATAPWATAQRLLAMRNDLVMAGWHGNIPAQGSRRLHDLAELDRLLPPAADLPLQINVAIETVQRWPLPQPIAVTCLEPRNLWPRCWRRLFGVLEERGVIFSPNAIAEEAGGMSSLAKVQNYLRHGGGKSYAVDDGSLRLLRAGSLEEVAEAVALLLPTFATKGTAVLLRTDPSLPLETAMARFHQPTTGASPASRWRSTLQLLPICLRMRWKPRSMQALLDFLLLPEAPVPARVRWLMAEALQEFPGIGNEVWLARAERARAFLKEKYADKADAKWQEVLQWLEPEVFDEATGMPLTVLEAVCTDISTWALRRSKVNPDNGLLKILAVQAADFAQMAREAGEDSFSRPTLEAMLDHECALGAEHVFSKEEAAPWTVLDHPGQLYGPVDSLVWWLFRDPGSACRHFWTEDELRWLAGQNMAPALAEEEHGRQYVTWLRALCCTRKQCLLVLPTRDAGQEMAPHPFWDHMLASFDDSSGAGQVFSCSAHTLLEETEVPCAQVGSQFVPQELNTALRLTPQPVPQRLSFSAAEKILQCPLHGLLACRLPSGGPQTAGLPILSRLFGNFSHYLLQQMLTDTALPTSSAAGNRMEALAERYLPTHAAPLLEQRHALTWQGFLRSMRNVAEALVARMKEAQLSSPQVELQLERKLDLRNTILHGRADICFQSRTSAVIWDLKWSYNRKKYAGMLDEGTAYQLAAYAWMQASVRAAAYWLLPGNAFLGTEGSGAIGNEIHAVDMAEMWMLMAEKLESIFAEWEHGIVGIAERDETGQASKASGCGYCEFSFVCGRGYA